MKPILLAFLLPALILVGRGVAQEPTAPEVDLEALADELSDGSWDFEKARLLVSGLIEKKKLAAAGFWLETAESAGRGGDSSKAPANGEITKLRAAWTKALPEEIRNTARDLLSTTEEIVRAKAIGTARGDLMIAEAALATWPDRSLAVRTRSLRGKLASGDDGLARWTPSLEAKRKSALAAWQKVGLAWCEEGVADFAAFGNPSGYEILARMSLELAGAPSLEGARTVLSDGDGAARLKRKAVLRAAGFLDIEVWLDGRSLGVLAGELSSATARFRGEKAGMQPLAFDVWPSSRLVLVPTRPADMGFEPPALPGFDSGNHVICVHLEIAGRRVKTSFQTASGKKPGDLVGAVRTAAALGKVGPLKSGNSASFPTGRKATKSVTFSDSQAERGLPVSSELSYPVSPTIEDFFKSQRVEGSWITGFEPSPLYFIDLRD